MVEGAIVTELDAVAPEFSARSAPALFLAIKCGAV
jgi:hypothetical protein